jgi:hypothetical protein
VEESGELRRLRFAEEVRDVDDDEEVEVSEVLEAARSRAPDVSPSPLRARDSEDASGARALGFFLVARGADVGGELSLVGSRRRTRDSGANLPVPRRR